MSDDKKILKRKGYTFKELDAITALTVYHDYASLLVNAVPQLTELFVAYSELPVPEDPADDTRIIDLIGSQLLGGDDSAAVQLVKLMPHILNSARLVGLCKTFLAGATVGDETCDENGMCEAFKGRPQKVYVALFNAVLANYPDLPPLLEALDLDDNDSEGETTKTL